jgi:hypothetical protein
VRWITLSAYLALMLSSIAWALRFSKSCGEIWIRSAIVTFFLFLLLGGNMLSNGGDYILWSFFFCSFLVSEIMSFSSSFLFLF